jgi:hypothetical protein
MNGARRWPAQAVPWVVGALALWALVPFGVWWAGDDRRYFEAAWQAWAWGTLVSLGLAAVALVLTRGSIALAALELWRRFVARPSTARWVAATGLLLAVLSVLTCLFVFAGNPRTVDGFADLFQARILLAGRLWMPAPPPEVLANFATLHMVVGPARWFSQYPPGQALVLAAGLALGAWWLLNPLFALALVAATYRVARWCTDEATARLAGALLCISPFVVAVSGSELSHLPAVTLGLLAAASATTAGGRRWVSGALAAGGLLGLMLAFRPLDAVAAAVPVAAIVLLDARRKAAALALIAVGGVLLTIPTLWYNSGTTGSWWEFGYRYLWGPNLALGFHPVPWGIPLTPARAVGLTGLDLHQLNLYLFDAPFPVLLLTAIGLVVGRRALAERDAIPVAGVLALLGVFFAYWHRDVFYGPRFLFSAVPWFVILAARAVVLLRRSGREILPGATAGLIATFAVAVVALVGLATIAPARLSAYRRATPDFDLHPGREASRLGLHHAVVVIPDGWGTRLIVRMWGLGVAPRRSTRLYEAIDACTMEQALDAASRDESGVRRTGLPATLDSLAAMGRPGQAGGATEDPKLRLPADRILAPPCRAELARDSIGFLAFAPFLYLNRPSLDGDIVWARDLGPWNAALFARYPDRPLYRYAPVGRGGPPVFTPLPHPSAADGVE